MLEHLRITVHRGIVVSVFLTLLAGCQTSSPPRAGQADKPQKKVSAGEVASATREQPEKPAPTPAVLEEEPVAEPADFDFPDNLSRIYDSLLKAQLLAEQAKKKPAEAGQLQKQEIEQLRTASRLMPESGYVHALIAQRLLASGEVEQARQEAEKALDLDPSVTEAYLVLGQILRQNKEIEPAIDMFRKALEQDSRDRESLLTLAQTYQEQDKPEQANELYEKFVKYHPSEAPMVYPYIAQNYHMLGKLEKAVRFYHKAVQHLPYPFVLSPYENMAAALMQLERFDEAIEAYQQLRSLDQRPKSQSKIEAALAQAYYRSGQPEKAYRSYKKAFVLNPDNHDVERPLGLLAFYSGDYEAAAEHLSSFLKTSPEDWNVMLHLAMAYSHLKNPEQAIALLEKIRRQGQAGAQAYELLTQLYMEQGESAKVEEVLTEAIGKGERTGDFYWILGSYQYDNRRYSEAEGNLRKALESNPEDKRALLYLGLTYDKLDKLEKLEEVMRRALKQDPNFAEAYNLLGYAYADRGINLEEAERLINNALAFQPDAGYILDSLGWLYYQQGRYEEAAEKLDRAARLMEDNPDWVVYDHLGDVYWKMDRGEDALSMWNKALEIRRDAPRPDSAEVQEDLRKIQEKIDRASRN